LLEIIPVIFLFLGNLVIGSLVFLQLNLQEQNVKLENSQGELKGKNTQLSLALSELNERVNELKEVRKQLSSRSEEERKRIARDLHDDTLARITDLRRQIESGINSQEVPQMLKTQLQTSIQTLNNVTHEIRRIINALRPSMLDNVLGLIPAIENLLDDLSKRSEHKISSKLITKLSKLKLSESNEIHLYRIIQEALNNVYKHSAASKVEVLIEQQPGQTLILVSDNGKGFHIGMPNHGFGLVDMKERAELIGANVQYLNKPADTGATLEITIPESKIESVSEESKEKLQRV
jgi:signal transduction histidine kinase